MGACVGGLGVIQGSMAGHLLSTEDRAHFLKQMRRQINSAIHRRMNVLLLLDDGWMPPRIATALFIDEATVVEHRRLYEARGRSGVEQLGYVARSSALSERQGLDLSEWLDATVPLTARQVCAEVAERFGVRYTAHAMAKYLHRLGYVYKKPKCVPAKADEAIQRRFLEETLRPLMQQAGDERPLYFVDAMHPAYTGRPAHGWVRRGRTLELKSNHGRCHLNINGALSWPERTLVHLEEEKITSAAMIRLFDALQERHAEAQQVTVILDNARYNLSGEIRAYLGRPDCRIRTVYLPSYAPNLNLIERLWGFIKRAVLYNKAYSTFSLFKQAFDQCLSNLNAHHNALRTLLSDRFHLIGTPNTGILPA